MTLDYELFFGDKVGTPQKSLILATDKLLRVLSLFNAKAVFFVDACYLLKLKQCALTHPELLSDYALVVNHIKKIESLGHQIQLHIHPHWFDSEYLNGKWKLNIKRFKLSDWCIDEADQIIKNCTSELNSHLENNVFAFRAGGWCIQPFEHIAKTLAKVGIWLDTSIYKGGKSNSSTHHFDFSYSPKEDFWPFSDNPLVKDPNGTFLEIPMTSIKISPIYYWRLLFIKVFGKKATHKAFGDGLALSSNQKQKRDIIKLLVSFSKYVATIDGYKSSLLLNEYNKSLNAGTKYFVVLGHPKAITPYSLSRLKKWLLNLDKNNKKLDVFPSRCNGANT